MYSLSELEKQEESILKFNKEELKKNVLYHYWLDATTGNAWFLGGQAWIDDNGINVQGDGVGNVEGLRFFDDLGGQIGMLTVTNVDDLYFQCDNDIFIRSLDAIQVWGATLELKSSAAIELDAATDIDVVAGAVLDVNAARLVIPTRTSDGSPRTGEIWLRTDL